MPPDIRVALSWIRRASLPITALQDDKTIRQVLDTLALKLDGTAASPDYSGRRRSVLYNILKYAVREKRLTENPLDTTEWEPPEKSIEEVNLRVVASPEQARELLTAVSYVGARRATASSPSSPACTSPCCVHQKQLRSAPMTVTCQSPAGAASN